MINEITNRMRYIESVVCAGEGIPPDYLHTKLRRADVCRTRQMVMALAADNGVTLHDAGSFYSRDHATASHSKKVVKNERYTYKDFDIKMGNYESRLAGINDVKVDYMALTNLIQQDISRCESLMSILKSMLDEIKFAKNEQIMESQN